MRRINPAWFLISLASICVAFVLVRQDAPLSNDGVHYLHLAKNLHDGQFKDTVFPPGFPAAIALVAQTGMSFELSARIVMFISAAVLPILFALAFRPSIGSRAAVLSGFCWLAFPMHASIARGVWCEPLFFNIVLVFMMLPVETNPRAAAIPVARGVLAATAYLVRPEALIIFVVDGITRVVGAGWRRGAQILRPTCLSVIVFVCCIAPYVLFFIP